MSHDYPTLDRLVRNSHDQPVVLLETLRPDHPCCRTLLFLDPISIIRADSLDDVPAAFELIDNHICAGRYAAGYVAYEAGYAFEPRLTSIFPGSPANSPLIWFGIYSSPACDIPFDTDMTASPFDIPYEHDNAVTGSPQGWLSFDDYGKSLAHIKSRIASGDTYQINYTGHFRFAPPVSAYDCYRRLIRCQPVSYAAYIRHDDSAIISLSPELFFRTESGRIWSRPMKGTIHRGRNTREDSVLAEHLRSSEKDRAENVMIVDLIRNDLGKVCKPGSITVSDLFAVEQYNTLLQMTSTVEGTLSDGISFSDLFRALFPCGSVTGAPKLRSMEIIRELEPHPRGVYTGAVGYAGPDGRSAFNVAIRTAVVNKGQGSMGIGSGIVWDSDPEAEYAECLLKRRFFEVVPQREFSLIETMRCIHGHVRLIDLHLDRLMDSAAYFGYRTNRDTLRDHIDSFAAQLDNTTVHKVRLLLHRNSDLNITSERISPTDQTETPVIEIAPEYTSSADTFLYHKTTNRSLYEKWYGSATKRGLADIVFTNERGEITEGCISNLFVKIDSAIVTPPLDCGLLNGIMRRYILHRVPTARERILTPDDLRRAERIWLTNAVRGIREVVLAHE